MLLSIGISDATNTDAALQVSLFRLELDVHEACCGTTSEI